MPIELTGMTGNMYTTKGLLIYAPRGVLGEIRKVDDSMTASAERVDQLRVAVRDSEE